MFLTLGNLHPPKVLDSIIVLSKMILNPRAHRRRLQALTSETPSAPLENDPNVENEKPRSETGAV